MRPVHQVSGPPRSAFLLGLVAALMVLPAGEASAQYALSIPFNPWGAQYEAFSYPVVSSNTALPNQARLQYSRQFSNVREGSTFNPFADPGGWLDAYLMGGSPDGSASRGRLGATNGGRYIPYYSFNRLYDNAYNRQYTPNAGVDKAYYENRQLREELYLKSLSENDPEKRAEILRRLERANQASRNELGTTRRRVPGASAANVSPGTSIPRLEGSGARRASANPTTATSRALFDREAPAIPPAPNALENRAGRESGLPPSSLSRPRSGPGISRPSFTPRSLEPGLESRDRGASDSDLDRDPTFDAPSQRRGTVTTPSPR